MRVPNALQPMPTTGTERSLDPSLRCERLMRPAYGAHRREAAYRRAHDRSRPAVWRAIAAFAVVAASLALALTGSAKLGLDLRGGTQIVLETQDSPTASRPTPSRPTGPSRCCAAGSTRSACAEPTLARSGEQRIIVELPGVQDPREAAEVIGRTAQLTFHAVLARPAARHRAAEEPAERRAGGRRRGRQPDRRRPSRSSTATASPTRSPPRPEQGVGQWVVNVDFNGERARRLASARDRRLCQPPGAGQRGRDPARRRGDLLARRRRPMLCAVGIAGGVDADHRQLHPGSPPRTWPSSSRAARCRCRSRSSSSAPSARRSARPPSTPRIEAAIIGIALTGLFILVRLPAGRAAGDHRARRATP